MKIGIIGPNALKDSSEKDLEDRKIILTKVAEIISKSEKEIVLTPDKNSLLEFFGKMYSKYDGKKIWIVAPMKDDAEEYLNLEMGEIIDCEKWYRQPSKFNESCDLMVCLGYAAGVLSEIGASQYFNPKKIFIVKEFVSSKLPREINRVLDIEYVPLEKLEVSIRNYVDK